MHIRCNIHGGQCSDLHDLKGTVWSVEDFEMLDIGSSNVALKESARTSVAQADRFPCKR